MPHAGHVLVPTVVAGLVKGTDVILAFGNSKTWIEECRESGKSECLRFYSQK